MKHRYLILGLIAAALAVPPAAAAALPETIRVDALSDQAQSTETVLDPSETYTVVAGGTTSVWSDRSGVLDALYCFESYHCEERGPLPNPYAKLRFNGQPLDGFAGLGESGFGIPYEESHRYEVEFTGVAGQVTLSYPDDNYADNSGFYDVTFKDSEDDEPEPTCDSPFEPGAGGEEIVGGPNEDVLIGTDKDDVICGLGSGDIIDGEGGNDIILGGGGPDTLRGGEGTDLVKGERGGDILRDDERPELDIFSGGRGTDSVRYSLKQAGVVAKIGGIGGEPGEGDEIRNSIEELLGTRFDDELVGNGKRNKLTGKGGTDRLKGRGNGDKLLGGPQGDILEGGARTDTLRGGRGDDDLFGDGGRDRFFGEQDDDNLFAKDGRIDRVLNGGPGTADAAFYDRAERSRLRLIELR